MKTFLFLLSALFSASSFSQTKMVMTIEGKQNELLGYTMDPDGSGDGKSISLLGSVQNSLPALQLSYASGNPISSIYISIAEPGKPFTSITLTDATIYAIKGYTSTYTNGVFSISSGATLNTEIKCKYKKIEMKQGDAAINDDIPGIKEKNPWEIRADDKLKGMSGQLRYHMPDFASYAHTEVFKAGTKEKTGNFFGNGHLDLLPGKYDILLGKYRISNIPVEKGKITLLKLGGFNYSNYGSVDIADENNQHISHAGPFKILLPPGTYYLNGDRKKPIVIKDGEITTL